VDVPSSITAAERELSLDDLVYLNRMTTVGQVLPNVAHELNNALQVVSGLVEMLGGRSDLPPGVADKLARIGAQSGRATGMLRELVAFARREDAGVRTIDVLKVLEAALSMRRYHLARARIDVSVTHDAAVPPVARGDAHALQQVLLNILINAEQSMAGREGGRIAIALTQAGEELELVVDDSGPGVAPELRGRITEPFFTTKERAAGLGLTVAAALLQQAGGRLLIEHHDDGGGTRAVMTLPGPRRPD
jgi:C4-dicarboxylate-specific signal transduction histidine kinase